MNTGTRHNAFGDLSDLTDPTPEVPREAAPAPAERPSKAQIDRLARETGFVSRERPRMGRRHRTQRNQQLNLKVTDGELQRFYAIADGAQITLGEAFSRMLEAYEARQGGRT